MKIRTTSLSLPSLAVAILSYPLSAWTATQTYDDTNGANVWDTTTSNWDGSTVQWTNGNDAVFGGTGEAVAISPVTVQNLTINSTGYSFTGGILTFAGTTPTVTTAQDVTLASTVTGTAGLIKTGAGVLTVSESGSITGGITVNQGTLRMNQSGHPFNTATGWNGGAVTVNAGGTVVLANDFNAGYARAFTINGGTLNATAGAAADSNNYLNNLTLQNGASVTGNALRMGFHSNATVTVGGSSASTISGRLLLVNGGGNSATFNVADATSSSANDLTVSGIISDYSGLGGTPVIKTGVGTLLLSGANSYSGVTTVNAGTVKIGSASALGAIQGAKPVTQVIVNSGGAIDFNGVNDATYGYTIAGTGVGGTGALVNTGSSIGNGIAQTSNIKLSANATVGGTGNWALLTNGFGATSLDLNGLTMTKAGSNTLTLVNSTTTAGTVVLSAGGLQFGVPGNTSTGVNGAASAFVVNSGTLTAYINSSLGSLTGTGGAVSVDASRTLTVGALNTSPAAFAGSMTLGAGSTLSKTGTGTLLLTGAGSGPATVSVGAGTFRVAGTRGFNEGFFTNNDTVNYTVAAGATLDFGGEWNTRSNNSVTLNGGTMHFSAGGSENYLNTIVFNSAPSSITSAAGFRGGFFFSPTTTVNAAASGSTISSTLYFVNNGGNIWTFNVADGAQAADLTLSGVAQDLSGWSGMRLVKSGAGRMVLTAANTYTAETTVSAGTLALTGSGALSDSSTVNTSAAGAVFDLSGISASSETIGALAGAASSSVVLGGKTLVAGASNASTSFAGAISGAGTLTKTGTGTLTLSGANAHTGGTTISAGTIAATNSSAFSTGTVTLNGGTLNTSVNLSNAIVLNNTSNFIAPNGFYRLLSGQVTGAGGFKLTNGGGTPGLELNNPANNFAGPVEIDNGAFLRLSAAEVIPDTAVVVINGGGNLRLDVPGGGTETVAGLGLSGSIWVPTSNNNMHTLVVGAGNTTSSFSGAVGVNLQNNAYLNLVKTGSGTFTMSGASYFEGGTTVNGGTLLLNRDAAWDGGTSLAAGTANITANSGTTLKNGTSHSIWGGHQNTRTVTLNDATVDLTNGQEYFYKLAMTGGTVHRGPSSFLFRVGSISGAGEITTSASAATALISSAVDMTFGSLILNVADGAAASDLTISGDITENNGAGSGAKSLTKNGAGTLTLAGSNSYSGTTTLNAGTLALANVNALAGSTLNTGVSGSQNVTFTLPGVNSYNINGLAGGDALNLGGNTINVGELGATASYSGVLSGTGGFAKRGGGTQTLTGSNDFTGAVSIQQTGTLSVPSIANTGVAQPLGAGASPVLLDAGTLSITGSGSTDRGLTLGNNANTLNIAATVTLSGSITGGGSSATLTKSGAGTFNQSGAGSWNSGVNVTAGTYNVTSSGSIAGVGVVTLSGGSTMNINTATQVRASSFNVSSGTLNLNAGTLRTNGITVAGGSAFGWGAGTLTVQTAANGSTGSTDRTGDNGTGGASSGPTIYEGTVLTVNNGIGNTLATSNGSVLDLGGLYKSGALRYDQFQVTGTLNLSANDTLQVAINPYLLRPTSPNSVVTGDWGTLVLVYADTIIGEFDTVTGITGDAIGWTQMPTENDSGRLPSTLGLNEWMLEYRTGYGPLAGGDAILLHYRVSGSVPEPASAGLLVAGALLLRTLSRRRG